MGKNATVLLSALLGFASPLSGGCSESTRTGPGATTTSATAVQAPHTGNFVSLSGTVVEADDDSFELDYGAGQITVEMDGATWMADEHLVLEDDYVTVRGWVDDGFWKRRTLDASSIYVSSLGTQFFAADADEERYLSVGLYDVDRPEVELVGTVASIQGREFALTTGTGTVDVDTTPMRYDPLDEEGYQQIEVGDLVRVSGRLEPALFIDRDLAARSVVTLHSNGDS